MGFNTWRSLSILLLASAALIGCNNPEKDKKIFGASNGNPPNNNALAPSPNFPKAGGNAAVGSPWDKSPGLVPASGPGAPGFNPGLSRPGSGTPIGGPNNSSPNSSFTPQPGVSPVPSSGPFGSGLPAAPEVPARDPFASGRPEPAFPTGGPVVPLPNNFRPGS